MKNLLIFLSGLTIGGAVVYGALRKKVEDRIDAEIGEIKAYYENKYKKVASDEEEAVNEPILDLKSEDNYDRDSIVERLNYGAMFKGTKDDVIKEEMEGVTNMVTKPNSNSPVIISDDEYYGDLEYDKVTVTYYSESKEFVSGKGTPIPYEDMIENIGDERFLEEFGQYETDTLFVRNPEQKIDYEVILEEKEYDGE